MTYEISDAVDKLTTTSEVECRLVLSAPWGIRFGRGSGRRFYLITGGACWFESTDGLGPLRVERGDLVLVACDYAHQFRDTPSTPVISLDRVLAERSGRSRNVLCGGGGSTTTMVGGTLRLGDEELDSPVVAQVLPATCHIKSSQAPKEWFESIQLLDDELASRVPGSARVASHLMNVVLTQFIRGIVSGNGNGHRRRDSTIAKALALVHRELDHRWTVEGLASRIGVSRSSFTARFREVTGESPMKYVQQCRLARAAGYLAASDERLIEIATRTGYVSEVALSKAFKREFGMSPGAYRKASKVRQRDRRVAVASS